MRPSKFDSCKFLVLIHFRIAYALPIAYAVDNSILALNFVSFIYLIFFLSCRANPNVIMITTKHGGHLAYFEGFRARHIWYVLELR